MCRDSILPSGRSGRVGATDLSSPHRFGRSRFLAALNFALPSVNLQRGRAIPPSHGSFQSTPRIRKVSRARAKFGKSWQHGFPLPGGIALVI
jgi:hypothetical protein